MFASLPHFLNADPVLNTNVVGLSPDPKLHDFISNFRIFQDLLDIKNLTFT